MCRTQPTLTSDPTPGMHKMDFLDFNFPKGLKGIPEKCKPVKLISILHSTKTGPMDKRGAKGNSKYCDICDMIYHTILFVVEFSEESRDTDKWETKYSHIFALQNDP